MPSVSDDAAISVDDLRVTYRTQLGKPAPGVRRLGRGRRNVSTVEALRGVSFSVARGTVVGIVGRNGAGKSTLMRAMAGIVPPSAGTITVRGRVSTMLSLGLGFNRELSGRENIMLGGLAFGLTKAEVEAVEPQIIEFAELGDFIDYPIRAYSSGMTGRLAFAVSAHIDPEILLIDEGLAAGDPKFKEKCFDRVDTMFSQGRTVILVSHSLLTVADLAQHCIWLHEGKLMREGEPEEVIDSYMKFARIERRALGLDDV